MRCGARSLSLVSLGFGLVATGALSLAVATDYWLFTVEPIVPDPHFTSTANESQPVGSDEASSFSQSSSSLSSFYVDEQPSQELEALDVGPGDTANHQTEQQIGPVGASDEAAAVNYTKQSITVRAHSGLWRLCILNDEPGKSAKQGHHHNGDQTARGPHIFVPYLLSFI